MEKENLGQIHTVTINKKDYPIAEIVQNHNIRESVKLILKTAINKRCRLIPLLSDNYPNKEISQKEFDRVCIIIDYLRPMWHHNTGEYIKIKE